MTQSRANGFSGIATFILKDSDINTDAITYNIIDYATPSCTMGAIEIRSAGEVANIPGDVAYEQSTPLRFIVDENLKTWFSLYDIQANSAKEESADIFSLKVTDNKHKVIAQFNYEGAFITNISPLNYSTINEETTIFIDVTLNYKRFVPSQI